MNSMIKFIITSTFISMMWWRNNIVIILLSLELIIISSLCLMLNQNSYSFMSTILMLSFMVSGSSIGLSLLVSLSRSFNSSNSIFIWSLIFDKINFTCYIIIIYK